MGMSSYQDLRVWQHAIQLALSIYRATEMFLKHEIYGLSQQMRRAAVSIASNIAEGKGRNTDKAFRQFLFNARGSLLELETQIVIAHERQYIQSESFGKLREQTQQVGRSLAGLLNSLVQVVA
jgi:four helix bundle protein